MKCFISNRIKSRLKAFLMPEQADIIKDCSENQKKIFVFLGGYYRNLGDMAITVAQCRFLKENFPGYRILCVPANKTFGWMKSLKSVAKSSDIITVTGGGNMSDKYSSLEDARRFVIKSFPDNRIIVFPQTCDFSADNISREARLSIKTYSAHKNLTLFARESKSFDRMKKLFPSAGISLCPDTAFLLDFNNASSSGRKGAAVCLRSDCECSLPGGSRADFTKILTELCSETEQTDTTDISLSDCAPDKAESSVNSFLTMLSEKSAVVTDRLHCMIFCALTATPCIAFDNSNNKISAIKEDWLKNLPYIKFLKPADISEFKKTLSELLSLDPSKLVPVDLKEEFYPLNKALKEAVKEVYE